MEQEVRQGTVLLSPGCPQGHSPSQIRAWGTHHQGPQLLSHCSSLEAMGEDTNSLPGLRIIPATSQGAFVTLPQTMGQAPSGPTPRLWHQAPLPHGDPSHRPQLPPQRGLITFFLVWHILVGQCVLCFGCYQATDPPGEGRDGQTDRQEGPGQPGLLGLVLAIGSITHMLRSAKVSAANTKGLYVWWHSWNTLRTRGWLPVLLW